MRAPSAPDAPPDDNHPQHTKTCPCMHAPRLPLPLFIHAGVASRRRCGPAAPHAAHGAATRPQRVQRGALCARVRRSTAHRRRARAVCCRPQFLPFCSARPHCPASLSPARPSLPRLSLASPPLSPPRRADRGPDLNLPFHPPPPPPHTGSNGASSHCEPARSVPKWPLLPPWARSSLSRRRQSAACNRSGYLHMFQREPRPSRRRDIIKRRGRERKRKRKKKLTGH